MKLSVLMITYNHEKYIAEAIESVLMQEVNFEYEIIIGEDCSTDSTRNIILKYKNKYPDIIIVNNNECNLGMHNNFINTYNKCRGKYIALLEGDDYWTTSDKLQKQVDLLDSNDDYVSCFHAVKVINSEKNSSYIYRPATTEPIYATEDILRNNFISNCSVVLRNGLIDDFPKWFCALKQADWSFHLLNSQFGNVYFMDEIMATYRMHSDGVWTGMDIEDRYKGVLESYYAFDQHFRNIYHDLITEQVYKTYKKLVAACCNSGSAWKIRKIFPGMLFFMLQDNEWGFFRTCILAFKVYIPRKIDLKKCLCL
jgi:glycosyltransferase involved in cell wall biosynthesis